MAKAKELKLGEIRQTGDDRRIEAGLDGRFYVYRNNGEQWVEVGVFDTLAEAEEFKG